MTEATMTNALPRRADIAQGDRWNAESVYATLDAFEKEFTDVIADLDKVSQYQGRLAEGPAVLADWMEFSENLIRRAVKVYFYGTMEQACDSTNQESGALAARGGGILGRTIAATSFTDPELLAIGRETLERWLREEPRLAQYGHYVDDLFRRQAHVRSADVEEVLGMLIDPFQTIENTSEMLVGADLKFAPAVGSNGEEHTVAQSTIGGLLSNSDREVRRTAWENYSDGYLSFKNTLANNLTAAIKTEIVSVRARRYDSALEASLFANNIPTGVFENLINTYKKNLPTWHRYWRIRREALGVDALQPYDIWAPLTGEDQKITFDQAMTWISEGLNPLGSGYVDVMRRGVLEQRWVDRYPNEGKRQGAFSFGTPGTHPFIMMSFQGESESMSTLAHELGHSMHSYFTWENQPFAYSQYSLFVAEVASNFNQAMVRAHLLNTYDDPNFQIGVLEEAMSNFHRYFFIMPTLARFELEMHQRIERGEATPADDLINLMADLFEEGYGGEMSINRERVGITWATFGHLYAPFYVYQYATGISAANALAKRILEGTAGAAENYLKFLQSGSSVYPLDALKIAGIDMNSPEPVTEAFEVLSGLVDRLEQLTGR
jgi:oligoendopeptidase F